MSIEISHETLFKGYEPDMLQIPTPEAPRNELSAYVLYELPNDLRQISDFVDDASEKEKRDILRGEHKKLAIKHGKVLGQSEDRIFRNSDPEQAAIDQLDMLFMLGSYLPAEDETYISTPESLLPILEYQKSRFSLPNRMTYELIIDKNTSEYYRSGQIRLFSDGDDANHERDFYVGHNLAEPKIKSSTYKMATILRAPVDTDKTDLLQSTIDSTHSFVEYMRAYTNMPDSSFGYFRKHLATYPDNIRNASGAFMPSVQLFELLLQKPSVNYELFLDESMPYFPPWSQPLIQESREKSLDGFNLVDMVESEVIELSEDEKELMRGVVEEFIRFGTLHIKATHNQVPEAFPDNIIGRAKLATFGERNILDESAVRGTAGFNIQNVLGNRVFRLIQLKDKI